ncbi:hypothetical protein RHMOL_Rhmol10G0168900 [Rhododendron molle]|uniref:Uncharacterized protein n=1 Tax=Rhododendron molle TaxID=49168 RepID=A0ACC0M493_RHOML|nr:hypothetical protein RHMOL_Rhmol10G0168900 [Rhododendron molle]
MTNQLVADPYFPCAFPYVYDYYQEHGDLPLPEAEKDGDVAVAPVLVQIAPLNGMEFAVKGEEEDPKEPPEEEDPEEPKEGSEDEEGFHDLPQNEADWQHLMQMQHLDEINEGWQFDDDEEEIVVFKGEPDMDSRTLAAPFTFADLLVYKAILAPESYTPIPQLGIRNPATGEHLGEVILISPLAETMDVETLHLALIDEVEEAR